MGVYVSHWLEVVGSLEDDPIYKLTSSDIRDDLGFLLSMRSLYDIAAQLGPYDVALCNCHHAALAMYNACAKEHARVPRMPNHFLTWGAWALRAIGVDIARSDSTRVSESAGSRSASTSAQSVSQSDSRSLDRSGTALAEELEANAMAMCEHADADVGSPVENLDSPQESATTHEVIPSALQQAVPAAMAIVDVLQKLLPHYVERSDVQVMARKFVRVVRECAERIMELPEGDRDMLEEALRAACRDLRSGADDRWPSPEQLLVTLHKATVSLRSHMWMSLEALAREPQEEAELPTPLPPLCPQDAAAEGEGEGGRGAPLPKASVGGVELEVVEPVVSHADAFALEEDGEGQAKASSAGGGKPKDCLPCAVQ